MITKKNSINIIVNSSDFNDLSTLSFLNERTTMNKLLDDTYFPTLEATETDNERNEDERFLHFTDLELLYYFIHRPRANDEAENPKESTKKDYLRDLLQFYKKMVESEAFLREDIKDCKNGSILKNLKRRHAKSYQTWLSNEGKNGKPYKKASIHRKITVIKSFLNWLYQQQVIEAPIHIDFKRTTVKAKDQPNRDLSTFEVLELLRHYKDHPINHAILLLLATTGARISAIANAKWSDLRYDAGFRGGKYYLDVEEKGDKKRSIVILKPTLESLKRYRKRRGFSDQLNVFDTSPLLPTKQGECYYFKTLSHYVATIIQKSNLEWLQHKKGNVTAHWFRHSFAVLAKDSGAHLRDIQLTLGHGSSATTEIYLEKKLTQERDVALLLDEAMFE